MNISLSNKVTQIFLLIFLAFIWGSSFLLMKRGLIAFSANELAATRIVIACVTLLPFAWNNLKLIGSKDGKWLLISALSGNGIPAFLFATAQTKIASSLAGMLNSLTPLFTLLVAIFLFQVKIKTIKILGVIVGLIGSISLVYVSNGSSTESNYWYSLLVIAATVCYGISVNVLKEKLHHLKAATITSLAFFIIGPPSLVFLLSMTNFTTVVQTQEGITSLFYIALLAIFGTAMAVVLFNKLIKHTSSVFASSVTYIIPIVAIFWGVLDGESLGLNELLLFGLILSGVALVMKADSKKEEKPL